MTSIDHLFTPKDVLLDLPVSDRQRLFDAVGAVWAANHGVDAAQVVRSLNARELLGSTGLGQGVAIPHARSEKTSQTLGAFVRPVSPVDFDAPDTLPVDCFVFLLVPQQAVNEHLELLGQIAKRLSSSDFRNRIRAAGTPEQVNCLFAGERGGSRNRSE